MTPIGWLAVYDDGAGGEIVHRSTDVGKAPKDLPKTKCLGVRTFYAETTKIDDGPLIHYSDIWVSWDWVVFYKDGNTWRVRNSAVDDAKGAEEAKEGLSVSDARWDSIVQTYFLNNDDNRVGQW